MSLHCQPDFDKQEDKKQASINQVFQV